MPDVPPDETPDNDFDDFEDPGDEESGGVRIPVSHNPAGNPFPRFNFFAPNLSFLDEQIRRSLAGLVPKVDVKWTPDMSAHFRGLIFPDLRQTMAPLFEQIREWMPPNWPTGIDHKQVVTVFQDEGLPIVWVPRREIVEEMLAAPDRDARIQILLARTTEVVEDCREVLTAVTHPRLAGQLPLVAKAIDAFGAGHQEAAQALAVVATETVVARALGGYKAVKQQVSFDPERVTISQLRLRAALAPIGVFYTTWYPSSGTPAPTELSRHVTVHQADLKHYTPGNAVVAVLLAASVIRAIQELYEIVDRQGQANP
ncbi:hypothetical protein ACFFMM_00540 [Micromonospora chaiyaphumensis]|uniref:Uncharacterized protein n=1 Tax=Micromonospora chaiyaphumensis TaxID=307119 RepID=A0A1C4ZMP1_9ACTN|nr:hypothetical protein [Micromonospora chaiyaphumensis]SCF34149.1 hypothetical protein GA0070214_11778 [Micromonospora chaiyaphumensis]